MIYSKTKNVVMGALTLLILVSLTGCQTSDTPKKEVIPVKESKPAQTEVTSGQKSGTVEVVKPVQINQIEMSATYSTLLKDYQQSIPRVKSQAVLPEAEQKKALEAMKNLVKRKASSTEIFKAFEASVVQLAPSNANQLAELAMAGLNKNLTQDNLPLEKLSSNLKFMNAYFKEAEKVNLKFGMLLLHPEKIENKEVKAMILKAHGMGYSVASSEGMIYYLTDYAAFAKYTPCYTEDFANLVENLAFDTLEPMTSDAALVISLDNLAARTLHLEKGLKAGGGTKYQQFQASRYISDMMYLLYGANNTPNFDYETNRLSESSVEAYKKLSAEKSTQTAKAILAYMKAIEGNKGIVDEKLNKQADGIIKDLRTYYGLTEKDDEDFNHWTSGQ